MLGEPVESICRTRLATHTTEQLRTKARQQRLNNSQCTLNEVAGASRLSTRPGAVIQTRQETRQHGFRNDSRRHAEVKRLAHGPLAGALLSGDVQNLVDNRAAVRILHAENLRRDFNEEAFQLALVPLGEDAVEVAQRQAQHGPQQMERLRDGLHVRVLYAVVHHFDKVTRAAVAHPVAARLAAGLGADRLADGLQVRPCFRCTAGHQRRAVASTVFAARNAHADEQDVLGLQFVHTALGVVEVRVTAINDDITRLEERKELLNCAKQTNQMRGRESTYLPINSISGSNHNQGTPRALQSSSKLLKGVGTNNLATFGIPGNELVRCLRGSVIYGNSKPVIFHIQNQIAAHHRQTDNANISRHCCRVNTRKEGECK